MRIYKMVTLGLLLSCLAITDKAMALSFTGTFINDDDVQLFTFTITDPSEVTLRTMSYAGGTLADGTVIPAGGFDPVLSLFNSAGMFLDFDDDDDDGVCSLPADPNNGSAFDACLVALLAPDTYTVALIQFDNFANGPTLADGFFNSGDPFFTANFGCPRGQFCDVDGNDRTPDWALDITTVTQDVPEPGTWLLLGTGLTMLLGCGWRRRRVSSL